MAKKLTSIRYKIFFVLLTMSLLSCLLVGGVAFYSMQKIEKSAVSIMLDKNKDMLQLMTQKQGDFTRAFLKQTERTLTVLTESFFLEKGKNNKELYRMLEALKNNNPYFYNTFIATSDSKLIVYSQDINFKLKKDYDPIQQSWYQDAIKSSMVICGEPYQLLKIETSQRRIIITCSKAIYDLRGNITGVIGVDITIDHLNKDIINTKGVGESGYSFLINANGNVIARPEIKKTDPQWDEIFTIPLGEDLHQVNDSGFQHILSEIINKNNGFVEWKRNEVDSKFIAFQTVTENNWSLGVVNSKSEIEYTAKAVFFDHFKRVSMHFIVILMSVILLTILMGIYISNKISLPIKILSNGVKKIGAGDLSYSIELSTGDELEGLANDFNKMSADLQQHIVDLETTTKQKEYIESELNIASKIQRDMLPMIFPAFPENKEIDIYASMDPAKQVGGDFYDFFMINKDKLCFVIADVSGKGVPAALFMVISKTLIQSEVMKDISPAEALYNVNNYLNTGNDEMMFVTVLLCIMDLNTGEIEFANAGHNPPLLMKKKTEVEYIPLNKSKILGVFPNVPYTNQKLTLTPEDILILYTDGVTEAMDIDNNQFSEKRLHETLLDLRGEYSLEKVEVGIQNALKDFVGNAEQSDDITLLLVRYHTGNRISTIFV